MRLEYSSISIEPIVRSSNSQPKELSFLWQGHRGSIGLRSKQSFNTTMRSGKNTVVSKCSRMHIKSSKDVIKQNDFRRRVDCPCERHSRLEKYLGSVVHSWLSMNYLLSAADECVDIKLSFKSSTGLVYLSVRPLSPTSVLSPASNSRRSRSSAHWRITNDWDQRSVLGYSKSFSDLFDIVPRHTEFQIRCYRV